jgi:hypothetical protein
LRAWFELVFAEASHLPFSFPRDFAKVQLHNNWATEIPPRASKELAPEATKTIGLPVFVRRNPAWFREVLQRGFQKAL